MVTTNQENKYVITVVIASIINVLLNANFIPKYGATSAAIASLISEIIDLVLYCWFARKYVRVTFSKRYIISIAIPLVIYGGISIFIFANMNVGLFMNLMINIISCIILYFGIGLLLKNESMVLAMEKGKELLHIK